jgi:hypothetical protein
MLVLVLLMLMVEVDLSARLIMLFPMHPGMHLMVHLCFITRSIHPMCFTVKMVELLLPMWYQNARRVRFAFGLKNLM